MEVCRRRDEDHVVLHPTSWPLFGLIYRGMGYVWCVLPFGFCESPHAYHTFSEAKEAYLWSKRIPALAYLDDSWLSNFQATHRNSARDQWLAAVEAIHVAMLVPFVCGYFLSAKKSDLRPTQVQLYLAML